MLARAIHGCDRALPPAGGTATFGPMSAVDADRVRDALCTVLFPNFRRDIVTLGMVQDLHERDGRVRVRLRPGTDTPAVLEALRARVTEVVGRVPA